MTRHPRNFEAEDRLRLLPSNAGRDYEVLSEESCWVEKPDPAARRARDAADLTQAQARGLSPTQVERCGLAAALEDLTSQVELLHGVSCAFANDGPPLQLEPEVALHLYRIAQEAIHNAVLHGGADRIFVRLDGARDICQLVVEDNGRGFRPAECAPGPGLGLMEDRAAAIGGKFRISPRGENGTRIECGFCRTARR